MITVESIKINEFRGIRSLELSFGSKSFGICGPNGTGKSGVVDALEFALTGNVSRLSGEGRGEVSLKEHGPHVDLRNNPEKAHVVVKIRIPSLGKSATIERNLKNPSVARIVPDDNDIARVVRQLEDHPEVVLSRRELIKYVLATPGKRSEEVQALLHLEKVDKVRTVLQKIANALDRQLPGLETAYRQNRDHLLRALGTSGLTVESLLLAANAKRAVLGLAELKGMDDKTNLRDGMATTAAAKAQQIPKAQALADLVAARESLQELSGEVLLAKAVEIRGEIATLLKDPTTAESARRETFLSLGLALDVAGICPYCDTPWEPRKLRELVSAKLAQLKEIARKRAEIERKLDPVASTIQQGKGLLDQLLRYTTLAKPPISMKATASYSDGLGEAVKSLRSANPLNDGAIKTLEVVGPVPREVQEEIVGLEKTFSVLPDPSKQDEARDWLTIAQERLEAYRGAKRALDAAKAQAAQARLVSDAYGATSDSVLSGIYSAVEKDFAALYSYVNRVDEKDFKARLAPSMGKLGFDVDFYGRGYFPPGAYHSEGHQDGMGLCLYLALMRHIQGKNFTFAVLDDVLMSVDAGHRREVCALLKKEFPSTQFVMTTHDPIWLKHMKTEGLTGPRASAQFRLWTVDQGPVEWDDRDVWAEIAESLKKNDVRTAAGLLRNFLEYVSWELCHRLRAPVEFRGDAQYQLGELLPAAMSKLRELYSKAKNASNSWGKKEEVEALKVRSDGFGTLVSRSQAEQWQMNSAIHFNSWENLAKRDFEPVVTAFQALLEGFKCKDCGTYLRVTPERETADALRCDCGKTNFNLQSKKAT